MKIKVIDLPYDEAYIIPISDLHVGDEGFTKESRRKLMGYLDWVEERPNARIFLNGDLMNCATRSSKTSPWVQNMTLDEQIDEVISLFTPVKDKIIGAVSGNHEQRIEDFAGYDPTSHVCRALGCEYMKYTGVVIFRVGKRKRYGLEKTNVTYTGVFQHTTGGGGTVGGKINRVDKMRTTTITNADFYCGGHNHMLGAVRIASREIDSNNQAIINKRQLLVDTGGYLEWDNTYPEAKQLAPTEIGSMRIRLDGKKKDLHASE